MNDRYLFKAKLKKCELFPEAQQWVQGYYVHTAESDYIVSPYEHTTLLGEGEAVEIEVNTLCQCTGLKDKNGKLIWENDIVRYTNMITGAEKIDRIEWNETHAAFVRLHRSQMGLQYLSLMNLLQNGCEVIGSAIDNPELLEVGE